MVDDGTTSRSDDRSLVRDVVGDIALQTQMATINWAESALPERSSL
jgi:hypothetical protein